MALFSAYRYVQWLNEQNRPKCCETTEGSELKVGRPLVLTEQVEGRLVERIDEQKVAIDGGAIRVDRLYGDVCGDADALRSFMLRELRRRLISEGHSPADAKRRADEFASSPEFNKKLRSHKTRLSRARKRSRGLKQEPAGLPPDFL